MTIFPRSFESLANNKANHELRIQRSRISSRDTNSHACIFQVVHGLRIESPRTLYRCSPICRSRVDVTADRQSRPARKRQSVSPIRELDQRGFSLTGSTRCTFTHLASISSAFVGAGAHHGVWNSLDVAVGAFVLRPDWNADFHQNRTGRTSVILCAPT